MSDELEAERTDKADLTDVCVGPFRCPQVEGRPFQEGS